MAQKLLVVCAKGEEDFAERIAQPLRAAGYEVVHEGTVLVGRSPLEEASKFLGGGGPVVLCATGRAIGTKASRLLASAARSSPNIRLFIVQMEEDADVEQVAFGEKVANFLQDPMLTDLLASLQNFFPPSGKSVASAALYQAELSYRRLALDSCDIIDLANLPETDRHLATRQLELRRLYVPLRVRVEIPAQGDASEAALEALERRREAWRRAKPSADSAPPVPVGERLAEARQLVILGDPGAGKSTMVRWIAASYLLKLNNYPEWRHLPDVSTLPDEDWLPVIVRCRDLRDPSALSGSLDDVLRFTLRKAEMKADEAASFQELLRAKLTEGQALLLFDGLDEIAEPTARARFCQQVEQIHIAYPKAPIVATSRIVGYREMKFRMGRGFEHVTVADLSADDKDDFARRWCDLTEVPERRQTAAEELIRDIHSTDRIERLTGNPMLLTTMALVKRKVHILPRRRADLYWEAVQVLLNWRPEVDQPIDPDEALPQLRYLGYEMCRRGVQQLQRPEILELLERMRDEYPKVHAVRNHTPAEFLQLLERRTGILIEAGHVLELSMSVPVFEFRHLTFQEYLAARALVDGQFPGRDYARTLAQNVAPLAGVTGTGGPADDSGAVAAEQWREAIRLCVACLRNSSRDDEVDDILMAILTPLQGEDVKKSGRQRAILAVLCLADEPNVSDETAKAVLQEFVRRFDYGNADEFWASPDPDKETESALKELGSSRWAPAMKSTLAENFIKGRGTQRISSASLFMPMVEASVPKDAARLQNWIEQRAQFLSDQDPLVAIEAAMELFTLGDRNDTAVAPSVTKRLFAGLTAGPAVQSAVALILAILNGKDRGELSWRPSSQERIKMIALLADPAADFCTVTGMSVILSRERDARAVGPLIDRLSDEDDYLVSLAARALGDIADRTAVSALIPKLHHRHEVVRRAVAEALGGMADSRATEDLVSCLQDPDPETRQAAAEALGKIADSRAVEALISALQSEDVGTRLAVTQALGKTADSRAVEPLISASRHGEDSVRRAAISSLGAINDSRAISRLLESLEDEALAYTAAPALGQLGEAALPGLLLKLEKEEFFTHYHAASALRQVGKPAVAPLIAMLQSDKGPLRARAAQVLGHIKDPSAMTALIAALRDEDMVVRWYSAEALGRMGQPEAIEPLVALCKRDSSSSVAAARALAELGQPGTEALRALLSSTQPEVRVAALTVLAQTCSDKTDANLLTESLAGDFTTAIDPQKPINDSRIHEAADKLGISREQVLRRYRALAKQFHLILAVEDPLSAHEEQS